MKILVLNCGSSSLKYQLIDSETEGVLAKGLCERIGIDGVLKHEPDGKEKFVSNDPLPDHATAVKAVMDALVDADHGVIGSTLEIGAVGHRVVHGGEYFANSVLITEEVKEALRKCIDLAPLHNPANIIGIEACEKLMPGIPQVAVFDTAFHQTMPEKAYLYALPYEYYEKYKVRKYGFHGTSHRFVSQECAKLMGRPIEELMILLLVKGLAKLLPIHQVLAGNLKGTLGDAQALSRHADAPAVQCLERQLEALARLGDHVLLRHIHIL